MHSGICNSLAGARVPLVPCSKFRSTRDTPARAGRYHSDSGEGRNLPIPPLELSFQRRLEPPKSHEIPSLTIPPLELSSDNYRIQRRLEPTKLMKLRLKLSRETSELEMSAYAQCHCLMIGRFQPSLIGSLRNFA